MARVQKKNGPSCGGPWGSTQIVRGSVINRSGSATSLERFPNVPSGSKAAFLFEPIFRTDFPPEEFSAHGISATLRRRAMPWAVRAVPGGRDGTTWSRPPIRTATSPSVSDGTR